MTPKRTLVPRFIMGVLVAAAILAFVGLPFGLLNFVSVQAQYAGEQASAESICGGSVGYQVRLFGDTPAYADSGLTQLILVITTSGEKVRQKFLICENTLSSPAWKIVLSGSALYIPGGSGEIVPREYTDNQPGTPGPTATP